MMAYAGAAEVLLGPEDEPVRFGELPLLVLRPDVVMDAMMAVRSALQTCCEATKGNV